MEENLDASGDFPMPEGEDGESLEHGAAGEAAEMDFTGIAEAMLRGLVGSAKRAAGATDAADGDVDEVAEGRDSEKTVHSLLSLNGYTYESVVGYGDEIARLRALGVVDDPDPEYIAFVEQMRKQHGLHDEPTGRTLVFCAEAREDADRLMLATANELGNPTVLMRVMENMPGVQALCIVATPGVTSEGFDGKGTLVLEGVDQWGVPGADMGEAMMSGPAQGALKAVQMIRMSVANPQVTVFASASAPLDPGFFITRLLGDADTFEVPAPSAEERDEIWDHLMRKHVSMSALDRYELVELSRGLPRCDIFAAAHEAVVQAFRASLEKRVYVPVTRGNLLDKVAAYQPVDSEEYRRIEDGAVEDLRAELERIERGEL